MMMGRDGELGVEVEADKAELLSVQLHYNKFLTQQPIKLYLDKMKRPVDNEAMKHMILSQGNHTLRLKGPELSLDETCILVSMIEYEVKADEVEFDTLPGIIMKPGIQSIVVDSIKKGTSKIPLPSLSDNADETVYSSTLLLHFGGSGSKLKTQNAIELDMNFDTEKVFDYYSMMYYEASKDKVISYLDIRGKDGADVEKQFEVIHNRNIKLGNYLAHFVVFTGDQLASKFDMCMNKMKASTIQSLNQDAGFYYNDFGKEDFTLAITSDNLQSNSKFYDTESNVFFIEVVYDIKRPSFIELAVEYDISLQNVDIFVFQDFNDELTLEDQELTESNIEIPSIIDSIVSRHTSIYIVRPGKYSIFIVDKKLPTVFKQMKEFEDISPCAIMKISHSIQPFSPDKLVKSSVGFLSVWPRRLDLGEPFFVDSKRGLEVLVFPNTLKLSMKTPPEIKFAVVDLQTNKKLYNIDPDKTTVVIPTRPVKQKDGINMLVKEIQIQCYFEPNTLQNVIGAGKVLTLADPESVSDKTMVPYYVVVSGQDSEYEDIEITPNKTESTQQVKEKLSLKQQRTEINKSVSKLEKCYASCKKGDCNKMGECICRKGYEGINCDQKKKIGKLDKIKQRQMDIDKKAQEKRQSMKGTYSDEEIEDYDDEDDEEMFETIRTETYSSQSSSASSSSTRTTENKTEAYTYGWFDILLLFLLLFGIAIIFYQNLWSGRFCRKKFKKKFKYDEEDNNQEDRAIIKEEFDFIGENIEMPKIRKKHDD